MTGIRFWYVCIYLNYVKTSLNHITSQHESIDQSKTTNIRCLPEAEATSVTLIPDSLAIYPKIVKTTRPLKNELNPTDATHIAVALNKENKILSEKNYQ